MIFALILLGVGILFFLFGTFMLIAVRKLKPDVWIWVGHGEDPFKSVGNIKHTKKDSTAL